MRLPRCTIDSSCVIALDHLDLLPQLSFLFSRVLVPKAVREELLKQRSTKDRLRSLFDNYEFLERCDDYDRGTVHFLLAERHHQGKDDRGEVEAVVQAAQVGAMVIVDDAWGRDLATSDGLEVHGTVWVLQRLHELQLLSSSTLRRNFLVLRARGLWLPWKLVDELLKTIGEEPL
jgi:predicted nucleic acid-binding protein